jgi:hypothetical protein
MLIEVEQNRNCEASCYARFKEAGPARQVVQVRTYDRKVDGEWCWVTGWSDDERHPLCPAFAQPVEDSGAGLTYVVFGGLYGIRLKPVASQEEWSLESPHQWGEPYLFLGDPRDLRFA